MLRVATPGARPLPILRMSYQFRTQRVPLYVAHRRQQVHVLLNWKRLEPALPHVAAGPSATLSMIPPDMRRQQPLHVSTEVVIVAWPEDQVKMVGHEAEGEQPHVDAFVGGQQQIEEAAMVLVGVEDLHAAVAAVDDVVADAADGGAGGAWHGGEPNRARAALSIK